MPRKALSRPTDAELAILAVLWEKGPATVREVHDVIASARPLAYTTTLKLMQIMTDKGLVRRRERDRSHVYEAALEQHATQRQLVGDLLDRAFGGSAAALVMQALATGRASQADLEAIRRLIDARTGEKTHGRD